MKAAIYHEFGDENVVKCAEVPVPEIKEDEVLVRVRSSSINRLDILLRHGYVPIPGFALPHISGMDVAGDVEQIGSTVTNVKVGDRVIVNPSINCRRCINCMNGEDNYCINHKILGASIPGGYAELVKAPATHIYKIADHISYDAAACMPSTYVTAWHALIDRGHLRLGEDILIHAGASGVGVAAIQIAKLAGARVIATVRNKEKIPFVKEVGADEVIFFESHNISNTVKEITEGKGVEVVLDFVGTDTWESSIHSLVNRGRLLLCGSLSGDNVNFALSSCYRRGIQIIGSDGFRNVEFEQVLVILNEEKLNPFIFEIFSLEKAGEAQRCVTSHRAMGKVLLHPNGD